jgi:hypothetical protein
LFYLSSRGSIGFTQKTASIRHSIIWVRPHPIVNVNKQLKKGCVKDRTYI